ncbi:MAG: type I restriction enzyme HsdR N-terminal domain-containing protein [Muribaculaceae bacterium]|nr:type I restriction enzyme HsdR N-terminal domain-containing protein [Muribaculaceae bacterium]
MTKLNLPEYQFNIKQTKNGLQIFDRLRQRFVALTPEEWVRQHFVNYLIEEKQYPFALMGNEISLELNGVKRRCDTLVAARDGSPLAVVEYKAPTITISQTTFDQIARYNMVLHAKCLMVSNGLNHYCCLMDGAGSYSFLQDIPPYPTLLNF